MLELLLLVSDDCSSHHLVQSLQHSHFGIPFFLNLYRNLHATLSNGGGMLLVELVYFDFYFSQLRHECLVLATWWTWYWLTG
jgi:hypothetical protein